MDLSNELAIQVQKYKETFAFVTVIVLFVLFFVGVAYCGHLYRTNKETDQYDLIIQWYEEPELKQPIEEALEDKFISLEEYWDLRRKFLDLDNIRGKRELVGNE